MSAVKRQTYTESSSDMNTCSNCTIGWKDTRRSQIVLYDWWSVCITSCIWDLASVLPNVGELQKFPPVLPLWRPPPALFCWRWQISARWRLPMPMAYPTSAARQCTALKFKIIGVMCIFCLYFQQNHISPTFRIILGDDALLESTRQLTFYSWSSVKRTNFVSDAQINVTT